MNTQLNQISSLPLMTLDRPLEPRSIMTRHDTMLSAFIQFSEDLDLADIKFKLIAEKGWTDARASMIEPQYKAFLFLSGHGENMLVPSHDVDEMWHAHILDTRKYMADCDAFFGEYIHHYPYFGMRDEEEKKIADRQFTETCLRIEQLVKLENGAITTHGLDASSCSSSSCSSSSSSCSSGHSSCSSSHSSCSSNHGHHSPPHSDTPYVPIIMPDTSTPVSDSDQGRRPVPSRPSTPASERRPYRPGPTPAPTPPAPKRNIFRRILGLNPTEAPEMTFCSPTLVQTKDDRALTRILH